MASTKDLARVLKYEYPDILKDDLVNLLVRREHTPKYAKVVVEEVFEEDVAIDGAQVETIKKRPAPPMFVTQDTIVTT